MDDAESLQRIRGLSPCMHGIVWEFVSEHTVWDISVSLFVELTKYWSVLHICLNLHGPVLEDEEGFSYLIPIKCGLILTLSAAN